MESFYSHKTKISEIAAVYTENQFRKLCETDKSYLGKQYVVVPSEISRGERSIRVHKGDLPQNCTAIVTGKVNPLYLAYYLNSTACQFLLFDGDFNRKSKVKVNRKKLVDIPIACTRAELEEYYCFAEVSRIQMDKSVSRAKTESDIEIQGLLTSSMEDLCDALAIEIFTHPFLLSRGVEILRHWIPVVDEFMKTKNAKVIVEGILGSDSILRNQLMKLHMVADNLETTMKNELSDGVED